MPFTSEPHFMLDERDVRLKRLFMVLLELD
jgi:hypothetical protein